MHYVFVDESIRAKRFRLAAIIVSQAKYTNRFSGVSLQSKKDQLKIIDEFIENVNGIGLICEANLEDQELFKDGQDSYSDVKRVTRFDNIWSAALVRAVQVAVIRLERIRGDAVSAVDVYHDPKSLTSDHREAVYGYVTGPAQSIFKDLSERYGTAKLNEAKIRKIRSVEKAGSGEKPNKFQRGIELVDTLLKQKRLEGSRSIEVIDITKHLSETLNV